MRSDNGIGKYFPELNPRRGELIAWLSPLLVAGAWLVLGLYGQRVSPAIPLMTFLLSMVALSISLGNWMDRQTIIAITESGISFRNGLRDVHLDWEQVSQVHVIPSPWGKKVQVMGDHKHFNFRTMGAVIVKGEIKGRLGFTHGEEILQIILARSNLRAQPSPSGEYYARQ